jgi:hypothetical protein
MFIGHWINNASGNDKYQIADGKWKMLLLLDSLDNQPSGIDRRKACV